MRYLGLHAGSAPSVEEALDQNHVVTQDICGERTDETTWWPEGTMDELD